MIKIALEQINALGWTPVYALLLGIILVLLVDIFLRETAQNTIIFVTTLTLVLAACLVYFVGYGSDPGTVQGQAPLFKFGAFYLAFSLIGLLSSLIVVFSAWKDMTMELDLGVFFSLLLLANAGGILIAASQNFIPLYIGYELVSIPTYAMVAFRKSNRNAAEAGLKIFLLGALSSAIIIYGLAFLYGATGTFYFGSKLIDQNGQPLALIAIGLIAAGAGFKIGLVPFHFWIPDVYSGAPLSVVNFLAASSKKMAFAFVFQLFFVGMAAFHSGWGILFAALATLSMILGNIAAVIQDRLMRLLAYSTIAQAGYIAIGIAAYAAAGSGGASIAVKISAMKGIIFHIIAHVLMKGAAIAAVLLVVSSYDGDDHIDNFKGLFHKSPFIASVLTIAFLSLMGIPPLAGFFGKAFLFLSAVDAGLAWLAIIGIIGSAISIFYYAKVIRAMIDAPEDEVQIRTHPGLTLMLTLFTILTLTLFLFGQGIVELAENIVNGV